MNEEMKLTGKQSTYKTVATNIVYTAKWILEHCSKTLKQYEPTLTVEQYTLLMILRTRCPYSVSPTQCQEPPSIHYLKENMLDSNSDVSRLVEKLRRKGWVVRNDNETDRRVANVCLTKKGHELLLRLDAEAKRWPEVLMGIPEHEAEKLNEILGKLSVKTPPVSHAINAYDK